MELGIRHIKAKCFISDTVFLPSYPDFNLQSLKPLVLLGSSVFFYPISPGAAEHHSRWFMSAQDLSKEQLSHFPTAQVVGICFFFFFFERHIFANCKWNSNPGEFKLISRFGIYITQVCLKHAKIISCLAQGCPRGPKPKPNKMIARNGEISSYFISVTFPVVLDICAPKAVE